jgi:hypothetical protein
MNFNFLVKDGEFRTFDISVSPTKVYAIFYGELPWFVPETTLGIKKSAMYNDMPYDSVWVKTDKTTNPDKQDKAGLTLYTLLLDKKFNNGLYINYYIAFQRASEKLIEKRNGKELKLQAVKERRAAIGYDFWHGSSLKFITEAGFCRYWDEAMPSHAKSANYKANGLFGSIDFGYRNPDNSFAAGVKFTCSQNDSKELGKLIETTGKLVVQGDFYVSFKWYEW